MHTGRKGVLSQKMACRNWHLDNILSGMVIIYPRGDGHQIE